MMRETLARVHDAADTIGELTRRVQAEYTEMPGLSVTLAQARRLLAADEPTCAAVFRTLMQRGVLTRTADGRYVLARSPRRWDDRTFVEH